MPVGSDTLYEFNRGQLESLQAYTSEEPYRAALQRIEMYAYPLENTRARAAYGQPSAINKLLIINAEPFPGRTTVLLVREPIGFWFSRDRIAVTVAGDDLEAAGRGRFQGCAGHNAVSGTARPVSRSDLQHHASGQ